MFSLICAWTKDWFNIRDAGDLRRYRAHYDVTVMNENQLHFQILSFKQMIVKMSFPNTCSAGPMDIQDTQLMFVD